MMVTTLLFLLMTLLPEKVVGQIANNGQLPLPLHVYGRVLYDTGLPVPNAKVQIWHTDINGSYKHPSSNNNGMSLLSNFQYFGTAETTPSDGSFSFVTYRPGVYGRRPTHIHFKVWINNTQVLTSQLYFADENTGFSSLLELDLYSLEDGSLATNQTIVVASIGNGSPGQESPSAPLLPVTPSQPQGPFYPVVDFMDFDNDLTQTTATDADWNSNATVSNDNDNTPNSQSIDDSVGRSSSSAISSMHVYLTSLCCSMLFLYSL